MTFSKQLFWGAILTVFMTIILFSIGQARELIISWDRNAEADLAGYKIYYGTSSGQYTQIIDVGQVTSYTVGGLSEGVKYFFAVTAYDTAKNESDFSQEVSATIPVTDMTPPTIYAIIVKSAVSLDLIYSEKVDKATAENIANYRINNGITITAALLDADQVTLHLTTSPHQAGSYSITVNNVKDLAHNIIAPNSSQSYQFIADDTTPPVIASVRILDQTHVDITFSEDVEKRSAETLQNYRIDTGITIYQVQLDQNNRTVHLVTSPHYPGVSYTVTVNNVCDRAPTPNYIAANSTQQYSYIENDTTAPVIYSVNIRNSNLVDVTFSEPVEQASAENVQNYRINNGVNVLVAILDINLKTIHLSTSSHQANMNYAITVSNVLDRALPPNKIKSGSVFSYIYQPEDKEPPQLLSAEPTDGTHLLLTFSEPLDRSSAEQEANYFINNGIGILNAKLDTSLVIVRVTTTAHQNGKTYKLTVHGIMDRSPNANAIVAEQSVQYTYFYQDKEPPLLEKVQVVLGTYLKIFFNEPIERESAELFTNYSINQGIRVIGATLDNSSKIVYLTTSEHQLNANYVLTVNNIRDRAAIPNKIADNTTYSYSFIVDSTAVIVGINKENYKMAYLRVGDKYYIDRDYTLTSIPSEMKGYLWIKTANDDRDKKDINFLSFQLRDTADVYVAYDSRATNYPNWLTTHFHRIGKSIGVSEYAQDLDIWKKDIFTSVVALGGNLAPGAEGVESMYSVIIQVKNADQPFGPEDPITQGASNIFLLYQNSPNPFNAGTEIRFQLPRNVYVELKIYNILGQTVRTLTQGYRNAGHYLLRWDGKTDDGLTLPSGVYFSKLVVKKIEVQNSKKHEIILLNNIRKMTMVK